MSDSDSGSESPVVNYRTKVAYRHPKLIDDDRNTKLHYLAAENDVDGMKAYLRNESQVVDPQNYMGWTPLMMACRRGHFEAVKCLLVHRANATIVNNYGMNAFQLSVANGNLEMTKHILEHLLSGGVSKRFLEHSFPVTSLAILYKHHDILEFLIENHFHIDEPTEDSGVTAYMLAHAMEFNEAITTLEKHKVDKTKRNYIGNTAADITKIRENIRSLYFQDHQRNMQAAASKGEQPEHVKTEIINQQLRSMLQMKPEGNNATSRPRFYPSVPYLVVPSTTINYLGGPNALYPLPRKSSNISPFIIPSPNISPLISMTPQIFFPSDFLPNQFETAQHFSNNSNLTQNQSIDLNGHVNMSSGMILSPVFMSPRLF